MTDPTDAPLREPDLADAVDPSTSLDEDNRLLPGFVDQVCEALDKGDDEAAYDLVEPLHPADIADLFELVERDYRGPLARAITDLLGADVLTELNDYVRDDVIDALPAAQVAELAGQLETDDAVAIIEEMEEEDQRAVLAELEPADRAAIVDALSFPEESAGRLMQRDLVAVPEHMNVGQLIDYLRENSDLTTEFWEIFIVDPQHRPVGTCQLSWILRTPRHIALADVMKRDQTLIPTDMDQEEVALRFQKYALISAAVVDGAGRLVGQITVDDIIHIVQEEAGEDIFRLSGAGDGDINEPVRETYKTRVRWLIANLGTALVASSVIGFFGGAIEQMVALAVLMPIVAGVGGNAGTQTLAVTVRALATNQLTESNTRRAILREMRIALMNGATIALIAGTATALWFHDAHLGLVIAAAMQTNILLAGLAGVVIPVVLEKFDQDPAVASSIFVTMTTDSMGFLAFLGLAVASGLVSL